MEIDNLSPRKKADRHKMVHQVAEVAQKYGWNLEIKYEDQQYDEKSREVSFEGNNGEGVEFFGDFDGKLPECAFLLHWYCRGDKWRINYLPSHSVNTFHNMKATGQADSMSGFLRLLEEALISIQEGHSLYIKKSVQYENN